MIKAYTWQAVAGVYVRYGQPDLSCHVADVSVTKSMEDMAQLAVKSRDAYTIKLGCAAKREWVRNPDPRFLAAADLRVS